MDELKRILAAMKACQAEMTSLQGKMASADADKAKGLKVAYDSKAEEFAGLKAEAEQAKASIEIEKTINDTASLMDTDDKGKNIAGDNKDDDKGKGNIDTTQDPKRLEAQRMGFFRDYCIDGGKSLSGNARKAITPTDPRFEAEAPGCIALPKSMVHAIFTQSPELGKAMLSTDATGGATDSGSANLFQQEFRPELLRMPVAMPLIYDLVRLVPAANGKAIWPKLDQSQGNFGGVAFTWKATEGLDKAETEPVFADFDIETEELSGWTEMSLALIRRSAIPIEATLTALFREAARFEFSRVILRGLGSGSNQPEGIIVNTGVNDVARGTAATVDWADLTNLEYAVSMGNRMNGRYFVNDDAEKYLKQTVDNDDRPLFTKDVMTGMRNQLAGYGYSAHEHGPALGTAGDVVFGNPKQYAFAIEEDIAIARSEHAEFKKGRVVFRLITFVGGECIHPDAFAILNDAV